VRVIIAGVLLAVGADATAAVYAYDEDANTFRL